MKYYTEISTIWKVWWITSIFTLGFTFALKMTRALKCRYVVHLTLLLIMGSSYSRAVFINFDTWHYSVIYKNSTLWVIEIQSPKKLPCCSRTEPRLYSALAAFHLWLWPHPLTVVEFVHTCGYYSRAATISFTEIQVWLLFEGSYYFGCRFYLNKSTLVQNPRHAALA